MLVLWKLVELFDVEEVVIVAVVVAGDSVVEVAVVEPDSVENCVSKFQLEIALKLESDFFETLAFEDLEKDHHLFRILIETLGN